MRKIAYINFLVCLALLPFAAIMLWSARTDPKALDREMGFVGSLHNSLYYLDLAKWKWAAENHKSEKDIPTMENLSPYLGEWTNNIKQFETFGVIYKITPLSEMEPQSDVATLTREVYFHAGFCRYYPAGYTMSLHYGSTRPELSGISRLRAIYLADRELFAIGLFLLSIVNLLILAMVKRFQKLRAR